MTGKFRPSDKSFKGEINLTVNNETIKTVKYLEMRYRQIII